MEYSASPERSMQTPLLPTDGNGVDSLASGVERKDEGSVKETVEQILIAFILAFIFRAFIVEAFVIPTGSMAPTLLGAHMRFTCPDCGYQFEENYNANQSGDDIIMPVDNRAETLDHDRVVVCPNCNYSLRGLEPTDPAFRPLVRYGDRILVLKYLYLFNQPHRWDVVVFKAPVEQKRFDFSQNYIKRLVGRPNESVMVLDGDVYIGANDSTPEQMVVQTKPREVQQSLWRIVADSDFIPRQLPRTRAPWQQPWQMRSGQSGWTSPTDASSGSPRVFQFDNSTSFAELFFKDTANIDAGRREDRVGGDRDSAFKDWLTYDADVWPPRGYNDFNYVGDLKLQFYYQRKAGDGPMQVMLGKRGETFIAELSTDSIRLLHQDDKGQLKELIAPTKASLPVGSTHRVEFTNVDYEITLLIDGKEVLKTTQDQYHPDISKLIAEQSRAYDLPPTAELRAGHQTCDVSHLSIWRDIYYISRGGRFNATANAPMRLGPDEYFVLGDNSQISGDGRYWNEAIDLPFEHLKVDAGKVPGRFLLGKAFFVYWPAGYRPFDSWPAIAPDFGDMRLIH